MEADNALNRAGGWFVLAGLAFAGNVYYAHKSQRAGHEAQAYRDQAGSHGGVTFMSYRHKPQDPNPPEPITTIVDLGPARNMEKRAEVYKTRSDYFFVAAAICGVVSALNLNKFIAIRASMDGGSVAVERHF
jgi:hypothetical protein